MASYFPMVKNTAQRIVFPILDADGDPVTGAAGDTPDSEYSLDGGSFSDCTNEISELATASGVYYLDLLTGETNGDVVAIQIKTATAGTKTTVLVFYTSAQSLDTIDVNVDDVETLATTIEGRVTANVATEAKQDIIDTNVDDIETLVTTIEGRVTANVATEAKQDIIDTNVDDIETAVGAITAAGPTLAEMDAAHALLATPAEVASEIADALKTDAMAETTQSIPSATPTIEEALMMLYTMIRNKKTVTSSELGVYNDAGTKIHKKALADDGSTYTEDEMISGA